MPVQVSARLRDALPGGPDIVIDCAGFESTLLARHKLISTKALPKLWIMRLNVVLAYVTTRF